MEIKKYKLGEIGRILNGSTPSTLDAENYDGDIVWVTPKDLSDQKSKYFYKGERNITQKGYDSCSTQMIPANNILMSSRAPIGLLAINKVDCCTNQGFKNIILDKTISDVDYMYYYLKYHIKEVEALGSGTTFKEVSKISFEKYEISLPDLDIQQKIASVLSSLDSKIALNRRINAKLEQMAKRLYDYWFVQFDFPNAEGKPYKSSGGKMVYNATLKREIPEGWEVDKLGLRINLFDSKRIPLSSQERALRKGKFPYYGATGIMDFIDDYIFDGQYILLAEDGSVETKDGFVVIQTIWGKNWVNNHAHIVLPKEENHFEYFVWFLKTIKAVSITTGSIQKKISQENLCNYKSEIPPSNIIQSFCELVNPLWNKHKQLNEETAKLTALRDKLLPLLMNGQVTVK